MSGVDQARRSSPASTDNGRPTAPRERTLSRWGRVARRPAEVLEVRSADGRVRLGRCETAS
jgi:hypothetical protein